MTLRNDSPGLQQWRDRTIMPTSLSSSELRELNQEKLERSVFSARTTEAKYVQEIADKIDDLYSGKINYATARLELLEKLQDLGYDPAKGFPDEVGALPARPGSLRDLSSSSRLDLVVRTNEQLAANYGRMKEGNTPYALNAFPAWELIRIEPRKHERSDHEERWQAAGESVDWEGAIQSPMMARKDSPIWQALGDGEGGFDDTLGNPYPPFAFGTGFGWREVSRDEAVEEGLIDEDEQVGPMKGELTPGEQEVNDVFDSLSPDIQKALQEELKNATVEQRAELILNAALEDIEHPTIWQKAERMISNALISVRAWLFNYGTSEGAFEGWKTRREIARQKVKETREGTRKLEHALSSQSDVPLAMHKEGVGDIDFDWGRPGNPLATSDDGYGISHLEKKHPDEMMKMPETIAKGTVYPHETSPLKKYIVHKDNVAVLTRKQLHPRWGGGQPKFSQERYGLTSHFHDKIKARNLAATGLKNRRQVLSENFLLPRGYSSRPTGLTRIEMGAASKDESTMVDPKIKIIAQVVHDLKKRRAA